MEPELIELVRLLKHRTKPRVIDVGCGTGRHVAYLARHGIDAYGFDLSETAVAEAEKLLEKEKLPSHLWVGDMFKRIPFEDGYFDAAVSTRAVHHGYIRQVRSSILEMDRVVRKGGHIFIQSPIWLKGEKVQNPKALQVEPGTLVWSEGEEAHVPHHHFTKEELLQPFKNYRILKLHSRTSHYDGWCLLARKSQLR